MTASETLIKAAFNRLKARMEKSIFSSISKTKSVMKEAPDQIRKEWDILKEEIIDEAYRINQVKDEELSSEQKVASDSQSKVDKIRAKLANLTKQVEELN